MAKVFPVPNDFDFGVGSPESYSPKLQFKTQGFSELERNTKKLAQAVVDPQSGISDALAKGLEETVVAEARDNIWAKFDTSGDFPSRVQALKINQYRVDVVVNAVYGAIQEYGGTVQVTDRARGFFWYKWYQTQDVMWKALALSETYTIPPRPYLRPAIDKRKHQALERAAVYLGITMAKAVMGV